MRYLNDQNYKIVIRLLEREKDELKKKLRMFGDVKGRYGTQLREVERALSALRPHKTSDQESSS